MYDEEAYRKYKGNQQNVKNEIKNREYRISLWQGKISRLDAAKKKIGNIKDTIKDAKSSVKEKSVTQKLNIDWKGKKYDCYVNMVTEDLKTKFQNYYDSVDAVEDTIIDQITALENKILGERTILSGLWKTFNNIEGEIRKLLN